MKNIIVNRKDKVVKISINPMFYSKEHVKQACKDYEEICSTKMLTFKKKIQIILKPKKSVDLDILGFEFMNYLLSLSKIEGI